MNLSHLEIIEVLKADGYELQMLSWNEDTQHHKAVLDTYTKRCTLETAPGEPAQLIFLDIIKKRQRYGTHMEVVGFDRRYLLRE